VNSNKKIGIVFIANKELNTNALGRIERCKGIVRIYDNVSQEINVKNQRNLLIARDNIDDIRIADIYNLISRENPLFQCAFSSCLGHTLYVAQNGDVSFCPKYIEESRIGTTNDISNIFENELFYEHLKNTIDHRNKCKNTCEYFDKCKGGCPFEANCNYFKTIYKSAEEELLDLEESCVDTSKIPLYKELALFNKLCSKIRHK
jgi:radical SAM protein with 4Fe4S-binding SPASM domain